MTPIADVFFDHGGRIAAAAEIYPQAPRPWIDLSTGISPFSYPAIVDKGHEKRLPEPRALQDLERAAGNAFGIPPSKQAVAVAGSDLGLRLLPRLIGSRSIGLPEGCYSGHEEAWRAAGAAISETADATVIVSPSNPEGRIFDATARHGGWLIVDEAFADATPEISVAGGPSQRLVVLRSFGKFYGLPGLRLGFVIAAAELAPALRALIGPWPVSTAAMAIGTAAYRDRRWAAEHRERLFVSIDRLDRILRGAGLEIIGGTALFRLVATPRAWAIFGTLADAGILTRPFRAKPHWLRFGLAANEEAWTRLERALN